MIRRLICVARGHRWEPYWTPLLTWRGRVCRCCGLEEQGLGKMTEAALNSRDADIRLMADRARESDERRQAETPQEVQGEARQRGGAAIRPETVDHNGKLVPCK